MRSLAASTLRVFLVLYILYGYAKFAQSFLRSEHAKKRWLRRVYAGRAVAVFDDVMLAVMMAVVALTIVAGIDARSFTSGLLVGMTLIQLFFHRFAEPLPDDWRPPEPVTPLKTMSYAIQAMPARAWREFAAISVLFAGALYYLASGR